MFQIPLLLWSYIRTVDTSFLSLMVSGLEKLNLKRLLDPGWYLFSLITSHLLIFMYFMEFVASRNI
jgi:hypothetical protein